MNSWSYGQEKLNVMNVTMKKEFWYNDFSIGPINLGNEVTNRKIQTHIGNIPLRISETKAVFFKDLI